MNAITSQNVWSIEPTRRVARVTSRTQASSFAAPEVRAARVKRAEGVPSAYPMWMRVAGVGFPSDRMAGVERYVARLRTWVRTVPPSHFAYRAIRRAVRENIIEARLGGFQV